MQKVFSLVLVVGLVAALSGCSALFGEGDYKSYSEALKTHSEKEASRIQSQADAIADASNIATATQTERALLATIAMMQIERLQPVPLGIAKPTTGMDVAMAGVNQIPFVVGMGAMWQLGKAGIQAAGNVSIGQGASVSGSLNKPTAVNIGGGNGTVTASPTVETVRPEIVEPVIVPGVQ